MPSSRGFSQPRIKPTGPLAPAGLEWIGAGGGEPELGRRWANAAREQDVAAPGGVTGELRLQTL